MDVRLTVDLSELHETAQQIDNLPEKIHEVAWREMRMAARHAQGQITIRMPKDWGHAQASWGNAFAVALPAGGSPRSKYPQPKGTKLVQGTWETDKKRLAITMGGLHYIKYLNEGHSQQAPSGFIDDELDNARRLFVIRFLSKKLL